MKYKIVLIWLNSHLYFSMTTYYTNGEKYIDKISASFN